MSDCQHDLSLINTDFEGIYNIHLQAQEERLKMINLFLTFVSAPFIVIVALASSENSGFSFPKSFSELPIYIYYLIFICGITNIMPLTRFIEANQAHLRTARAINHFRKLYTKIEKKYLKDKKWKTNLPTTKKYPPKFKCCSWASFCVIIMGILNSLYITAGIMGIKGIFSIECFSVLLFAICFISQYALFYIISTGIFNKDNPQKQNCEEEIEI